MERVSLLLDGSRGVYIPQVFAKNFDLALCGITDQECIKTLLAGPEHEDYWDAWDSVLAVAEWNEDGKRLGLEQDGDLFAIDLDSTDEAHRMTD